VAEAGLGSGFTPGERVWCNSLGHGGRQGCCAERAVVAADRLYRLPVGADPLTAVAALHPAATAFLGLHHRARVCAGQTAFVGGGAGSVGSCAVQFAKEAGLQVIATARPGDHGRCRDLGADAVFDYDQPNLADRVLGVAPGGVDLLWDTSGHSQLAAVAPMVADGGQILITAGREPQAPTRLWPLYTRDISVLGFVISLATSAELADAARAINRRLAGPGFAIRIAGVLPLARIAEAHATVEEGRSRGRIVIRIEEEAG